MKRINWKDMFTKQVLMVIYDAIAVNVSYFIAQISVMSMLGDVDWSLWSRVFIERSLPVTLVFFMLLNAFKVYSSMWEYAGIRELSNIVAGHLSEAFQVLP